jgi:hypothetical protein
MTWWMSPGCLGGCDEGPYLGQVTWPCPPPWPCPPSDCWQLSPRPPLPADHPRFPHPQIPQQPFIPAGVVGHKGDHGGACCGSCAKGGPCESECKDEKKSVGALYVSDAELDALGAQIALMGADVDAAATAERASHPGGERGGGSAGVETPIWIAETGIKKAVAAIAYDNCRKQGMTWDATALTCDLTKPDPEHLTTSASGPQFPSWPLTKFLDDRWSPLAVKWNQYRDNTFHEPTVFDTLRTEFSTVRDAWTGPLGQQTKAVVPPPLADTSGMNAIPWFWIGAAGFVVLLPFILPSVAAIFLLATRGKTMGLGGIGL